MSASVDGIDAHAHVFGPYAQFPLPDGHAYSPGEASAEDYLAVLDGLGLARGVCVQGSAHMLDNRALLAGIAHAPDRLRGIAVVRDSVAAEELAGLARRGIVGLRFFGDGAARYGGGVGIAAARSLEPAMRKHSLHAQLFATCEELLPHATWLAAASVPVVIDHYGRPEVERGTTAPAFQSLLRLLASGRIWVKLSGSYRLGSPERVRAFHDALVATNPGRLLWGSDWPHVNFAGDVPSAAQLLSRFVAWTPDAEVRKAILVSNPRALFGF